MQKGFSKYPADMTDLIVGASVYVQLDSVALTPNDCAFCSGGVAAAAVPDTLSIPQLRLPKCTGDVGLSNTNKSQSWTPPKFMESNMQKMGKSKIINVA